MSVSRPRTVLVTGAGRNIGRFLAETFAADGHRVGLNATASASLLDVSKVLEDRGAEFVACPGDVREPDQVQEVVRAVTEAIGPPEILINCAMVRVMKPTGEMTYEDWRLPIDVGLTGTFLMSQAVLPEMQAAGWGRIVNMAGLSGQNGAPNRPSIVAAKAGVIGLTKALAREFAADGITVNAVSPGLIATERGDHTSLGDTEQILAYYRERAKLIPVQRMGRLGEVAAACMYLCSEEAAFTTGQTLALNGGMYV